MADITSIAPGHGPLAGGTVVVVTGTGFTGIATVDFGPNPADSFTVDSDTQITATAPGAMSAGNVFILLDGLTDPESDGLYAYADSPEITSIAPSSGSTAGGTDVFITGVNFPDIIDVLIDGVSLAYSSSIDEGFNLEIHVFTDPHVAGTGFVLEIVCLAGSAFETFDFVEDPPPDPGPDPISTPDGCLAVAVPGFLADGVTPDADGIVYTPELVGGWYDSIPLRSATSETQPRGEYVTVAQELGRDVELVIVAHLPGNLPLGAVLCFTAMETIKAAFRILFVPVVLQVADPFADRYARARRVGPIKQTIVGNSSVVRASIPLLCPDPRRLLT